MKILVTGSRNWLNRYTIEAALDAAVVDRPGPHTLVHGAARGADAIAVIHARRRGWTVEAYPARWVECGPRCRPAHRRTRADGSSYCPTAGHRRNLVMVTAGADLCLAFIRDASPGASNCADLAEDAGIPTARHRSPARAGRRSA